MNSKSLFACLVILALVAFSAQGLKMFRHEKVAKHMAEEWLAKTESHLFSAFHIQDDDDEETDDEEIPDDFMSEFMNFVFSDP